MSRIVSLPVLAAALLFAVSASAVTPVCVDVQTRSWTDADVEHSTDGELGADPHAIDPARYLRRMMQYQVTHHPGFAAVESGCEETVTVELYPLTAGYTVFARYSGHAREEKVDEAQFDEFNALAERLVKALLRDRPIGETINRQTVLRSDSEGNLRTIDGEGHLILGLGTQARYGKLTSVDSGLTETGRLLTPMSVQLGYRGKFQAWAIDVHLRGSLGTSDVAPRRNPEGGHVDYDFGGAFALHFLRYTDPLGINSFYFGGGAQFELSVFSVLRPLNDQGFADSPDRLLGGGMSADLLIGYEFMRASTVHFFLQLEAHLPTYELNTEIDAGGVDTWLPGGLAQIGVIF